MTDTKITASVEDIKKFWDNQASTHGASSLATMPDSYLKELEIAAISRHLADGQRVADIGCGNGFSSFAYADKFKITLTGMDYSEVMIAHAREKLHTERKSTGSLDFTVGDVRDTKLPTNSFDRVITDRCLINLASRDDQKKAIHEMHRLLKKGGLYLMCEDTEQGLANLNKLRTAAGLEAVAVRWHNLYLDEKHIRQSWEGLFELVEEDCFSSLYYTASRVIYAQIAKAEGTEPRYDHPINKAAAAISGMGDFGDYGPLKLFVLRKI